MATHQELADTIKNTHIKLRLASRELGSDVAWKEHCENVGLLQEYSAAMKNLASSYWEDNNQENPNANRIHWVVEECREFFLANGRHSAIEKEHKLQQLYFDKIDDSAVNSVQLPLKMLDVGSCYNPFKKFNMFVVTAIDIAPASDDVIKCDFLKDDDLLPASTYDVVVFSFFLEYLPHPKMRFDCCRRAYHLLKPGGILLILTPDSKHDTANAQLMKKWRFALAHIGFWRTKYSKLKHLRCMTYFKTFDDRVTRIWLSRQKYSGDPSADISIPQDSNPYSEPASKDTVVEPTGLNNDVFVEGFMCLDNDLFCL